MAQPQESAGLLGSIKSFMSDPRNQAGLAAFGRALAQAGAPRRGPITWGGGLSDAFAGMTEGRQAYDERQLQKMLHTAQLGKANEEVRGKKRINDMIEKAMGGGMVGGNAPTMSASGDYGPGEAPNIPQPATYGANPFGLEYAMALGKDDITNAIKAKELGMTGVSRDPNKQYNGPQGWYTPTDAKTGLGLDPQGRSTLAPGFQQNIAALEAAKTGATEQAKADVASNVPQVFQGFGPGGAPVLATPRELRGGQPAQQDPNRPSPIPGLTERIQSELANNGIQFAADSDGNFKIVGIEPKKQNAAPTRVGAMIFGSNPIESKKKEAVNSALAGVDAGRVKEANEIALKANEGVQRIGEMKKLAESGVYSGSFASGRTGVVNFFDTLGVRLDPNKLANSQEYEKHAKELVLTALKAGVGSTNISDADREYVNKTVPQLETNPLARMHLLNFMEAKFKAAIDRASQMDAYLREKGDLGGFGSQAPTKQGKVIDFNSLPK
jgi:hypothetical protein